MVRSPRPEFVTSDYAAVFNKKEVSREDSGFYEEFERSESEFKQQHPEIASFIEKEEERQLYCLELTASENYLSHTVQRALDTCLSNSNHGHNENVFGIERVCQKSALDLFGLHEHNWAVNVQAYSGTPANLAVLLGLVPLNTGRILGLSLAQGGHQSHGDSISIVSDLFECESYKLDPITYDVDFVALTDQARRFRPNLIIAGWSCHPRTPDYAKFREISDEVGAYLLVDMSHVAGLVSADVVASPFDYAHVLTTTTHKSLRGPRGALIFSRKATVYGRRLWECVDKAVSPRLQGGAHAYVMAAMSVALREAQTLNYKLCQQQVHINAVVLARKLQQLGYSISTGGTDSHMVLVQNADWSEGFGGTVTGSQLECALDLWGISLSGCCADNWHVPGKFEGLRLGTCALTSRGLNSTDFESVAQFLHEGIKLCLEMYHEHMNTQRQMAACRLTSGIAWKDWLKHEYPKIKHFAIRGHLLREKIVEFLTPFPAPGRPAFFKNE